MNKKRLKIVFIGAGNVANALAPVFSKRQTITQVYSRTREKAIKLAGKLKCGWITDIKQLDKDADLYIIAVKDDAIQQVMNGVRLPGKFVVHTSGSVEMNVLKDVSIHTGVFYPVQTFTRGSVFKKNTPVCIESSDIQVRKLLSKLGKDIGARLYFLDSLQRAYLHLMAVLANNFTNHIFTIVHKLSENAKIPYKILLPLAKQTFEIIKKGNPAEYQTGPAIRNDTRVIKKQEQMLKKYPEIKRLYMQFTENISKIR